MKENIRKKEDGKSLYILKYFSTKLSLINSTKYVLTNSLHHGQHMTQGYFQVVWIQSNLFPNLICFTKANGAILSIY